MAGFVELSACSAILCDLDGCLISGNRVLNGAHEFVDAFREHLWVLSNNSTDTPDTLSGKLFSLGLNIAPDRIVLAGTSMIDLIAGRHSGATIALYGSAVLADYAMNKQLTLSMNAPEIVCITRDETFSYASLNAIIRHLHNGAQLYVSNCDHTHPGEDHRPVAETGALLGAIEKCVPGLEFISVGKPERHMYDAVRARLAGAGGVIVAIGDNPATDGLGAKAIGVPAIIIGSGPDADYRDLRALVETTPLPISS